MVELSEKSPCEGMLPLGAGMVHLAEEQPGRLTSISPYAGQQAEVSDTLTQAHGLPYPGPNETAVAADARIIWFGRDTVLLMGVEPAPELARSAALTDQTDAWAAVSLGGSAAEDVLARMAPVDLRAAKFAEGQTCRTMLGHMSASITRTSVDSFLILVFRSMAVTLVEELQEAMEAVAARG